MHVSLPVLSTISLLLSSACYQVTYPAQHHCSAEAPDCPAGFVCLENLCQLQSIDATSPRDRDPEGMNPHPDGPARDVPVTEFGTDWTLSDRLVTVDAPPLTPDMNACTIWSSWSCTNYQQGEVGAAQCQGRGIQCVLNDRHPRFDCACSTGSGWSACGGISSLNTAKGCDACKKAFGDGCCKP